MVTEIAKRIFVWIIVLSAALDSGCSSRNGDTSSTKNSFVGRSAADVEKELGIPVSSISQLNGEEIRIYMLPHRVGQTSTETHSDKLQIFGWRLTIENGHVVEEYPIYGTDALKSGSIPSDTKLFATFLPVSEEQEREAIEIEAPSDPGRVYFFNRSSVPCIVLLENIEIQKEADQTTFKIRLEVAANEKEPFRKFTSQSMGRLVLFAINNKPIAVCRILTEFTTGEFVLNDVAMSSEINVTLQKLGLRVPN